MQAKDISVALGKGVQSAQVEPVRGKLAERDWLDRTPAGRYLPR